MIYGGFEWDTPDLTMAACWWQVGMKNVKITQTDKLGQTVGQSIITPVPAASLL